MPNFSKKFMDLLLGIENRSAEKGFKSSFQARGPGRWDPWLSLAEGRKNAFEQREAPPPRKKKMKIIFANSLFNERAPTSVEIDFFSTLIEEYEVYLWPGTNKPLDKPLNNPTEFWEKRDSLPPATATDIEVSLDKLNLSGDEVRILDYAAYCNILKKIAAAGVDIRKKVLCLSNPISPRFLN